MVTSGCLASIRVGIIRAVAARLSLPPVRSFAVRARRQRAHRRGIELVAAIRAAIRPGGDIATNGCRICHERPPRRCWVTTALLLCGNAAGKVFLQWRSGSHLTLPPPRNGDAGQDRRDLSSAPGAYNLVAAGALDDCALRTRRPSSNLSGSTRNLRSGAPKLFSRTGGAQGSGISCRYRGTQILPLEAPSNSVGLRPFQGVWDGHGSRSRQFLAR